MHDIYPRNVLLASIAGAVFGFSSPVISQTPDTESSRLEEIVVTATRRESSLQSIPASITAVTGESLSNRGITNFSDITNVAAGLHLEQITNLTNTSVKIRGVGSAIQGSGTPSVGVLVDGVYQVREGAAFTEMLDVDRVEILRGPQGTLFGKNTTAGVIHIHTKDADPTELSGRIQGVLGNFENTEVRGMINVPLVQDKLALRVNGYLAKRDGYSDNRFSGKNTRNLDREGGRAKLLWNATDALRFRLTAETMTQKSRMDSALVEYGPIQIAEADRLSTTLPPIGFRDAQQHAERVKDEVDRYILHMDWNIRNHTLSAIAAYEEVVTLQTQDQDYSILQGYPGNNFISHLHNVVDTEATTVELQISSSFDGPINYVLGGFWQNEKLESNTTLFIELANMSIPRPASLRDVTSQAAFANVSYAITDRWTLSGGVRYSDDEVAGSNSQFAGPNVSFDEWTYSFKLQFQATPDKMFYLAYDKGFKDGGINREFSTCGQPGGRCVTSDEAMWDPEFSYNHELGFKTDWLDGSLRINGALFYQTYEDFQVTSAVPGEATVLVSNAAEVTSKGVEADFTALLTDHVTVDGSVAWIKTKYDKYENAPCTFPGCTSGSQDLSGKMLDLSPEFTANLGAEYRTTMLSHSDIEWFSRVDLSYRTKTNLFTQHSPRTRQDAYTTVAAQFGLESPEQWRVALWVRNLTNEQYAVSALHDNLGVRLYPSLPRTYGVTTDWFF